MLCVVVCCLLVVLRLVLCVLHVACSCCVWFVLCRVLVVVSVFVFHGSLYVASCVWRGGCWVLSGGVALVCVLLCVVCCVLWL